MAPKHTLQNDWEEQKNMKKKNETLMNYWTKGDHVLQMQQMKMTTNKTWQKPWLIPKIKAQAEEEVMQY